MAESGQWLAGLDIGGTKCAAVVGRDGGRVRAESRMEDWASGDAARDVARLVEQVRSLARETGVDLGAIRALGVSCPGPLDSGSGVVVDAPNLHGWCNLPLAAELEAALGLPVRIENDANAAALAEWRYGAGQGAQSLVYLTMSTGIGAGLILDGRLYSGAHFQAGEVGHIPIEPEGRLCGCGRRGCLEAYIGGAAIKERLRERAEAGEVPGIVAHADGDPAQISARTWVAALRDGDRDASVLRDEYVERTAQALALLVIALDPERFVLGTIVRENSDLFLDAIRSRTAELVWPEERPFQIVPGALGERLPACAALAVAEHAAAS